MRSLGVVKTLVCLLNRKSDKINNMNKLIKNSSAQDEMPVWLPRATILIIGTLLATYFGLQLFVRLKDIVFWLVTALFLSFALEPLVNSLQKRGWKRGLATGVILALFLLVAVVFVAAMVPLVITQVKELIESAPSWVNRISDTLKNSFGISVTTQELLDQIQSANVSLGSTASNVAGNILDISNKILGGIFQMFTILLFTFYFVAEGPIIRRKLLTLIPANQQKIVLETWEVSIDKTGGYLYSRLLLAVASAVVTFLLLTVIGVPFALPLALWMGLISQFIPVIGTFIAAALPLMVALLENPWSALVFVIYVVLYQQFENYVLGPRITAKTMQLHPAVAVAAALIGGTLAGVLGAFLALPVAAILQVMVGAYVKRHEVITSDGDLLGVSRVKK